MKKTGSRIILLLFVLTGLMVSGCGDDTESGIAGVLDTDFGTDGIVTNSGSLNDAGYDCGFSIAINSSNVYIAGYGHNGSDYDMTIWKYNSTGNLDASFGNGGIVTNHNAAGGDNRDYGTSIVLDDSGNIYVAGYSSGSSGNDMVIWKYSPAGVLDSSFGSGGIVSNNNAAGGNGNDFGYSIVLDASGNIFVTGESHNGSNADMVIWKYTPAGVLDSSFGNSGIVTHGGAAGGNGDDRGASIVLESSGSIYVAGYSYNGSDTDMVIWKYTSAGALDTTFGNGGIVTNHNAAGGDSNDEGRSIALDTSGNIYVTGVSDNGSNVDMVIWKYDPTGNPDTSFGSGGIVTNHNAAGGDGSDEGYSIALDASGRIYVGGYSSNGLNCDATIWKYTTVGKLDTSFGSGGIFIHDYADDYAYGIALDGSGHVYLTGATASGGDEDMVMWKVE